MNISEIIKATGVLTSEHSYRKFQKRVDANKSLITETIKDLDVDILEFLEQHSIINGSVLDIGTGSGIHSVHLAKRGFQFTGIDYSPTAIEIALRLSEESGTKIDFLVDDIHQTKLVSQFDIALDRGCLTFTTKPYIEQYKNVIDRLVKINGYYILKIDQLQSLENNYASFLNDPSYDLITKKEAFLTFYSKEHKIPAIFMVFRKLH